MRYNTELFRKHGITTLVTSCPICLKVFREDYALEGVEVLHHSEYILRLMKAGRLHVGHGSTRYTYHDPCELGRGSGIYDDPRAVIGAVGGIARTRGNPRKRPLLRLFGRQYGDLRRSAGADRKIRGRAVGSYRCRGDRHGLPALQKAIGRGTKGEVRDLAEIVVANIR